MRAPAPKSSMLADRTLIEAIERLRAYPLLEALFTRRSRRISRGASFRSGVLTFSSAHDPQPVSPLEEAVLIAATSRTGVTFADSPFLDEEGGPLLPTPLMSASAGASASPDQAFPTRFFMWNDSGTYFIRHPEESAPPVNAFELAAEELLAHVEGLKVKVSDRRPDFPRSFPAYLGRNRYSSNVPGSTVFVPLVEATEQYINGLLLVLSHPDGQRPSVLDDFNFYRPAGCRSWIRSGFLNRELKMPLGLYAKGRVEYEALLLTQNLALVAAAIGLGGWLHSTFPPIMLLGGTEYGEGLGFRFEPTAVLGPKRAIRRAVRLRRMLRPFPAGMPNPVGLDGVLEAHCPPYFANMDAAIDAVLAKEGRSRRPLRGSAVLRTHAEAGAGTGLPGADAALRRGISGLPPRDLQLHLRSLRSLPRTLQRDRGPRDLLPGPPRRLRLLRPLLPAAVLARRARPPAGLARGGLTRCGR